MRKGSLPSRISYQAKKVAMALNRRYTLPRYMNTRWFTNGIVYERYHTRCRKVWQNDDSALSEAEKQYVADLDTKGIAVIPPDDRMREVADRLRRRFDELIAQPEFHGKNGDQYRDTLVSCVEHLPEVKDILIGRNARLFEAFLQCHFKVYEIEAYRNLPNDQYQSQWMWHFDNDAYPVYKLIFYLTDTTAQNGPFAVHRKSSTLDLFERGFHNPYEPGKHIDALRDPSRSTQAVGPAGTAILFQNNLIHRATPPLEGHRDVISFMIQPSLESWESHFDRMGPKLSSSARYPVDQPIDPTFD
jgi:hypothetical protein